MMSLVKFEKRRPLSNVVTSGFFDMEHFYDNRFWNIGRGGPNLNIKESTDSFEIELYGQGFAIEDFELTLNKGCLNISAEKESSGKKRDDNFIRREYYCNSFNRSLLLPESIRMEGVKVKNNKGVPSFKLKKKRRAKLSN